MSASSRRRSATARSPTSPANFERLHHEIGLAERISVLTSRQLGRAVSMHHFRHSAATSIALDDPHHVQPNVALLGHSNLHTGECYYNMASTHDAGRRHQQALRRLRA